MGQAQFLLNGTMLFVVFQQFFKEGSILATSEDGGLWGALEASGLSGHSLLGLHPQIVSRKIHTLWGPTQPEHIIDFPPREGQLTLQCLMNHFTLKRYRMDDFSVVPMTVRLG